MSIETFILIGGRSTRFGRDKALAQFGGRKMVDRIADAVRGALPDGKIRLVAANDTQGFSLDSGFPFIFDLYPERGPLGGLHAALAYAQSEWLLALACDFPLITNELIERLSSKIRDDVDAVVPRQADGRLQPLCAFYRAAPLLKIVEDILEDDRPTPPLRSLTEKVRTRIVEFDEISDLAGSENFFFNANTPDDLAAAMLNQPV